MQEHRVDPSATHFAVSLVAALAKAVGFDGQHALDAQARSSADADCYGHLADAVKSATTNSRKVASCIGNPACGCCWPL